MRNLAQVGSGAGQQRERFQGSLACFPSIMKASLYLGMDSDDWNHPPRPQFDRLPANPQSVRQPTLTVAFRTGCMSDGLRDKPRRAPRAPVNGSRDDGNDSLWRKAVVLVMR